MATIKITEAVRSAALRRPLVPSVTRDSEIPGLCLIVTRRRGFWALVYQPRGINPATGKRWGGGVRHELGDAMLTTISEARGAALAVKSLVRQGRSPHHEAMTSRANLEASRAIIPTTVAEALEAYAKVLAISFYAIGIHMLAISSLRPEKSRALRTLPLSGCAIFVSALMVRLLG